MKTIDFRSDTVTKPTDEMRQVMALAEVGDDVYGDDPTMLKLEKLAAEVTGKQAALFVTSGTQGNLLAIMSQTRHGDEIILSSKSHVIVHEVGGVAAIAGCMTRTVDHEFDYVTKELIEKALRPHDIHEPATKMVCFENALSNGKVVPLDIMREAYICAKSHHLNVHLDGARIFNAATHLNVEVNEITKYCDTVMFCLSKGLGAPVGSMLCGPKEVIEKARRFRKMLGGGLRQSGILGQAGIMAIEQMSKRLDVDHQNAKYLAQLLDSIDGFEVMSDNVDINMVFARYAHDAEKLHAYLVDNHVKLNPAENNIFRFVTHIDITKEDIDQLYNLILKF